MESLTESHIVTGMPGKGISEPRLKLLGQGSPSKPPLWVCLHAGGQPVLWALEGAGKQEKSFQLQGPTQHLHAGAHGDPGCRRLRPLGLCRADALPACEQGLFSLHTLGLRFYEELPSVGALGIFIPGLRSVQLTVGLGNVPGLIRASPGCTKKQPLPSLLSQPGSLPPPPCLAAGAHCCSCLCEKQ